MKKRKKNIGSYQLVNCFTGEQLRQYRTEKMEPELRSRIFHHLNVEKCERCRQLYPTLDLNPPEERPRDANLSAAAQAMLARLRTQAAAERPAPVRQMILEAGQLWTTACRPKLRDGTFTDEVPMSRPVIIMSTGNRYRHLNNIIRVLPVSNDTDFQWANESVLLEQNPLGYPLLAEIFNEQPMLAGNLRRYVGKIDEHDLARIQQARTKFMDQTETESPDADYLQWKRIELDAVTYLAAPVNHALGDEVETAEAFEFSPEPIRLAAAAFELGQAQTTARRILNAGEGFELSLRQIGDQAYIRLYDESDHPPNEVLVDGYQHRLEPDGPDIYECCLGPIVEVTHMFEIQIDIQNRNFLFYGRFVHHGRLKGGEDV